MYCYNLDSSISVSEVILHYYLSSNSTLYIVMLAFPFFSVGGIILVKCLPAKCNGEDVNDGHPGWCFAVLHFSIIRPNLICK